MSASGVARAHQDRGAPAMMLLKLLALAVAALLLLWVGYFAYLSFTAPVPKVKLVAGHLRPCPDTPNCVSSESDVAAARIAPLPYQGSAASAWTDLRAAIIAAGGTIVEERPDLIWATFTSRVFRFVDDVECRLAADAGVIHLRSASRAGRSDLGVNRKRAERLHTLFEQLQGMRSPDEINPAPVSGDGRNDAV